MPRISVVIERHDVDKEVTKLKALFCSQPAARSKPVHKLATRGIRDTVKRHRPLGNRYESGP